ncbi:MAG: DUF11 domain-containing protein, partial [Firmicutes bacterium]|nr:DUF11 domain-containing protein [Bacillota bacterium]
MHANMTPITQLSKVTWPVPTAGAPTITKTAAFVGDDGSGEAPYVQYTVSFYVPDTCYNQPVYLDDHGFVDVYGSFGDAGNTARRFFFNVPGSPVLSVYSDALGERTLTRNVDYSLIDQVNNNGYSAYLAPDKWYLFFIGDTTGIAWPDLGPSSLWPFQDDTWLTFSYNLPLDEIVTDGHGHSMTLKEALQWTQGANPSDFQNWVTGNNPITNVSANVSIDWPIFKTGTVSGDTITYQVRLAATQFGDNFLNYADVFTDVFDPHLEYVPFSFRLWKYGAGYTYYGPYQMAGGVFTDLLSESISGNTMSFDFLNMPHIDWDTSLNQAVYSSDSTLLSDTPPLTDSFYYLEYRMRLKPGAPQGQLTVNNNVSINGFTNQFATQINTSGAASADLAVTKTGAPASVQPGDLLTYTVTTVNNGPDDAQDVTVNDSMPAVLNGAQFSVNGGVSWQPWNGSYTHGTLVSGASFILLLRGTVSAGATGNISNTAVVSST